MRTFDKHIKLCIDFVIGRKVLDIFSFFPLEKLLRNYFLDNFIPNFLSVTPDLPAPVLEWPDIIEIEGAVDACTLKKCAELLLTTGNVGMNHKFTQFIFSSLKKY